MTDWFQKIRTEGSAVVAEFVDLQDIDITDAAGGSLLHTAIAYSNLDAVQALIERGINVHAVDSHGKTPLHYACDYQDLRTVRLILDHGGLVAAVDDHGNTPLWSAVLSARGNYEVITALMIKGADKVAGLKNRHGRSPLDFATQIGDTQLVEMLSAN